MTLMEKRLDIIKEKILVIKRSKSLLCHAELSFPLSNFQNGKIDSIKLNFGFPRGVRFISVAFEGQEVPRKNYGFIKRPSITIHPSFIQIKVIILNNL